MSRRSLAALLAAVAVCLGSSPARGLDLGQWVPGLRLTPFLTEKLEYNSNVFQVPSGAQDDFIVWTMPGFILDYTFGDYTLSAGYRAEIQNYLELTSQNFANQIAAVQFLAERPRLTASVRNDFIRTNEPPSSEFSGPIVSNTNVFKPEAEYRLTPRLAVGANLVWVYVDYEDAFASAIDRNEYGGGATLFWKVFPKGDVRFDASYWRSRFWNDEARDVGVFTFTTGLRGELTEKIASSLRVGLQVRDAEQGQTGFTGLVFGGDLVYRPQSTTTITFSALRTPVESTFADEPFYVTTGGALGVRQEFLRQFAVEARIAGGMNDYPDQETFNGQTGFRRDGYLTAGVAAEYQVLPWLLLGVEYRHNFRRSNFDTFDFDQDRVWLKAGVQF